VKALGRRLIAGFYAILTRRRADRELDEELRAYLESSVERHRLRGLSESDALRAAKLELGSPVAVKEATRDAGWESSIEATWRDVRLAGRTLRKSPGFALAATFTLAVALGPNAAIATVVAFILQPLPVAAPERVAVLGTIQPNEFRIRQRLAYPDYEDYRAGTTVFQDLAAWDLDEVGVGHGNRVDRVLAAGVSGNYFSVLGLVPAAGRVILPSDDVTNGHPMVVLAHEYWVRRFAADQSIVGQTVRIDGRPALVIGVGPRGFSGTLRPIRVEVFLPLRTQVPESRLAARDALAVRVIGRLQPGVAATTAQVYVDATAQRLATEHATTNTDRRVRVHAGILAAFEPQAAGTVLPIVSLLLALVTVVLIKACSNAVGLMLNRTLQRQKDIALRSALGATRWQLIRPSVIEAFLVVLASVILGGGAGIVTASRIATVAATSSPGIPLSLDFQPNWVVFGYLALLVGVLTIAIGTIPALRVSRIGLSDFGDGRTFTSGRPRRYLRRVFAIGQTATSVTLLVVCGLFVRSIGRLESADLGFDPTRILLVTADPLAAGLDQARAESFFEAMSRAVRVLPGVEAVSESVFVPFGNGSSSAEVVAEGGRSILADRDFVSDDYFATLGTRMLSGESFRVSDRPDAPPVAVVNESMARQLWPASQAVGRRFQESTAGSRAVLVIGVTADAAYRQEDLNAAVRPRYFLSLQQTFQGTRVFNIRMGSGSHASPAATVPSLARRINPDVPVSDIRSLKEQISLGANGFAGARTLAGISGLLGLLAMSLAFVGTYAVFSQSVRMRSREIAVRLALGSPPLQIVKLVVGQGGIETVVAIVLGLAAAAGLTRYLAGLLHGVSPVDPLTFASVALGFALVASLALYLPARRATRLNITQILQQP
jgi:putative ABC transport system permease protein